MLCNGDEDVITQCPGVDFNQHGLNLICSHDEDVGVACNSKKKFCFF